MTVPQRSVPSKAILLLLSVLAGPVLAQDHSADDNRQSLFICGTDATDNRGFLDLSGEDGGSRGWVDLHFDRTANGDGHPLYSFPRNGADARAAFFFSHSNGPEGYLVSIRWRDEGLDYIYYSLDVPPEPADDNDAGGGSAGLAITRAGELVDRIACIERPYMFISYMRDSMSCDAPNPYGPSTCDDSPYERTGPLDVQRIGIVD